MSLPFPVDVSAAETLRSRKGEAMGKFKDSARGKVGQKEGGKKGLKEQWLQELIYHGAMASRCVFPDPRLAQQRCVALSTAPQGTEEAEHIVLFHPNIIPVPPPSSKPQELGACVRATVAPGHYDPGFKSAMSRHRGAEWAAEGSRMRSVTHTHPLSKRKQEASSQAAKQKPEQRPQQSNREAPSAGQSMAYYRRGP